MADNEIIVLLDTNCISKMSFKHPDLQLLITLSRQQKIRLGKLACAKWNVFAGASAVRWMDEFRDGVALCTSQ